VSAFDEGLDPVTGKEKRTWHPAGPDRTTAEQLARKLAAEARPARHASRRRSPLRRTRRSFYRRGPVEDPEEVRLKTVEAPANDEGPGH
jgi:hypothetical protein